MSPSELPRASRRTLLRGAAATGAALGLGILWQSLGAGTATAVPPGSTTDPAGLTVTPHQPVMHGYLSRDLSAWSSAGDPYAKYFRSRVPLAQRIPAFSATQAKPSLAYGPQVLDLSDD